MKITLKDADDLNRYFFGPNANKDLIYTNIHQCVEIGILNDLDEVHFCTVTFDNGDETIDMVCIKEEYSTNLDNVLRWYEETDQFEKCAQILTLKKRINE